MIKITFLCCWNNKEELNRMLLPSIDKLVDDRYEVNTILVNSTEKNYQSAAEAYNTEFKLNKSDLGDILIFCHQDIAFDNDDLIHRILDLVSKNQNILIGVAGMPKQGKRTVSNLKYKKTGQYIVATQLENVTDVESIDECLFAIPRYLFEKVFFDSEVCTSWHLYAVELCYELRRKFNTRIVVIPETIYHKEDSSGGQTTDMKFLSTLYRMWRKHRKSFDELLSPCYNVKTAIIPFYKQILRTFLKNLIGK